MVSRRALLVATGAGATALVAGGSLAVNHYLRTNAGPKLEEPALLESVNGLLQVNLRAAVVTHQIAGKPVQMFGYNGGVPGPTLKVKPGDKLRINLENRLGQDTNLHTHGLHVSPLGNSDNPFIMVAHGQDFQYEYQIPEDHPNGMYWYHPHMHGQVANQTWAGLYGAIVVSDGGTFAHTERVFVISDVSVANNGVVAGANMMSRMMGREGDHIMVNGQEQPVGLARDNRDEIWRIVNACVSRNMQVHMVGATFQIIGIDGHSFGGGIAGHDPIILAPGNRLEALVQLNGNTDAQLLYTTVAHPDSMGMMGSGKTYSDYPLFTIQPNGSSSRDSSGVKQDQFPDLRTWQVDAKREFVLNMPAMNNMMGMMNGGMQGKFTINGQAFDANRVDTTTQLGRTEEWTIVNKSTMAHPFHLHVWPMQVVSVGGEKLTHVRYQDVVYIPAKQSAVVRVRFADFTGPSVYHCHILDHEDLGMMGVVQVN